MTDLERELDAGAAQAAPLEPKAVGDWMREPTCQKVSIDVVQVLEQALQNRDLGRSSTWQTSEDDTQRKSERSHKRLPCNRSTVDRSTCEPLPTGVRLFLRH